MASAYVERVGPLRPVSRYPNLSSRGRRPKSAEPESVPDFEAPCPVGLELGLSEAFGEQHLLPYGPRLSLIRKDLARPFGFGLFGGGGVATRPTYLSAYGRQRIGVPPNLAVGLRPPEDWGPGSVGRSPCNLRPALPGWARRVGSSVWDSLVDPLCCKWLSNEDPCRGGSRFDPPND
jgi:hypothetical protein